MASVFNIYPSPSGNDKNHPLHCDILYYTRTPWSYGWYVSVEQVVRVEQE